MYKIPSKQLTFGDFDQPIGMKLDPNNHWVKKAELISWNEIETEYAKLFKGIKGHVTISARMALEDEVSYHKIDRKSVAVLR